MTETNFTEQRPVIIFKYKHICGDNKRQNLKPGLFQEVRDLWLLYLFLDHEFYTLNEDEFQSQGSAQHN